MANVMDPGVLMEHLEMMKSERRGVEPRQRLFNEGRARFRELVQHPLWTKLSADVVRELLMDHDEQIGRVTEREIYDVVMKWLMANVEQIPGQVDRVLSVVRFSAMSTNDKLVCLEQAKRVGLDTFVRPYMIRADWYRTCMELNFAEFTDLIECDRKGGSQFVGEGRRTRAIQAYQKKEKPASPVLSFISVKTSVDVLERVKAGTIDAGTVLSRPPIGGSSAKPPRRPQSGPPTMRPLPSEHLQFWRDEMAALAGASVKPPGKMRTSSADEKSSRSRSSSSSRGIKT